VVVVHVHQAREHDGCAVLDDRPSRGSVVEHLLAPDRGYPALGVDDHDRRVRVGRVERVDSRVAVYDAGCGGGHGRLLSETSGTGDRVRR
jgi:hypothetical protein